MKKYFISVLLLFVVAFQLKAQSNVVENLYEANEKAFLHLNSNTFLAGEALLFSFYNLEDTADLSQISKIGYVGLVDLKGNVVAQQKVFLKNGRAAGEIFIPTTVETGVYKLTAYTDWMLNEPASGVFAANVAVVNPFKAPPAQMISKDSLSSQSPTFVFKNENTSEKVQLDVEKEVFQQREKVEIEIESEVEGTFSLSVRKVDALSQIQEGLQFEDFLKSENNLSIEKEDENALPELRGELLTGRIQSKTDEFGVKNKIVALSMPGESFLYRVVETDEEGKFRFILDHEVVNEEAFIQVVGEDRENFEIKLDSSFADFSELKIENSLNLNPSLANEIEERSIALQIENAYYQLKSDSLVPQQKKEPFYAPLATVYELDKYTRFPTLAETIVEIVPEMYYTKDNGNFEIHLRDQHDTNRGIYGKTLVLVDGLLVQDQNNLFAYPMDNVERIELVNDGYIYGPKLYNGVVNFITKNKNFTVSETEYLVKTKVHRPAQNKIYLEPQYQEGNDLKTIPDYRYQLLWVPQLKLKEGENSLSFYTSDVSGIFEIVLEGISNSGEIISTKQYFTVE